MKHTTSRRFADFRREEHGTATIEACLWLPFFFSFFILVIDATTIFMNEARVQRVVQDGNRQYVTGVFNAAANPMDELETWIASTLTAIAPSASVVSAVDPGTGVLTTRVSYPAAETDLTGATGVFGDLVVRVQAVNQTEL